MKRIMAMLMSVVLTLGLTACGHTVGDVDLESGQSAIYIQKDGMVSYAVSESFDKDYYDKDELKKEIEAEIKAYNASSDASVDDAITLDSFSVSKKVATLSLDFTTTYDLLNYMLNDNRVEKDKFYIGTIDSNDDCKISGNFEMCIRDRRWSAHIQRIFRRDIGINLITQLMPFIKNE